MWHDLPPDLRQKLERIRYHDDVNAVQNLPDGFIGDSRLFVRTLFLITATERNRRKVVSYLTFELKATLLHPRFSLAHVDTAFEHGMPELANYLLRHDDIRGNPLCVLCIYPEADEKLLHRFIAKGYDVDAVNLENRSPLHYAIRCKNPEHGYRCARTLLQAGATLTMESFLYHENGRVAILELLLSYGGSMDHVLANFTTLKQLKLALKYGADLHAVPQERVQAIVSDRKHRVIDYLVRHGYDTGNLTIRDAVECSSRRLVKKLVDEGCDLPDNILFRLRSRHALEIFRFLVFKGVSVPRTTQALRVFIRRRLFDVALEALHEGALVPQKDLFMEHVLWMSKSHPLFYEMAGHGYRFSGPLSHLNERPLFSRVRSAVFETIERCGHVGRDVAMLCCNYVASTSQMEN